MASENKRRWEEEEEEEEEDWRNAKKDEQNIAEYINLAYLGIRGGGGGLIMDPRNLNQILP